MACSNGFLGYGFCCGTPCLFYDAGDYDTITASTWGAQSFVTPPGGLTLYSATAYLHTTSGTPAASDCIMKVYSNDSYFGNGYEQPQPDAVVATLTPPSSVTTALAFTSSGVSLTGSTRYWIVLSRAAYPATGSLKWKWGFLSASETENLPCDDQNVDWRYSTVWVDSSPSGYWLPASVGTPYKFAIN